jgi:predicted dienelactone hydrolase
VDFMTPEVSRLVSAPTVRLTRDYGPYLRGFQWADPDPAEAAKYMVEVVRTPGLAATLGARGRDHVRRVLDPSRTAALMTSRLQQVQAGHIRVQGAAPPAGTVAPVYS